MLPKMFYINLDKSLDRRLSFESRSKAHGLDIDRFRAFSPEDLDSYCSDWREAKVTPTEAACLISHLELIRNHQEESILVFEDDTSFDPMQFWGFSLGEFLNEIPKEWEVTQLAVFPPPKAISVEKWGPLRFGCVSYLISPQRSQYLVNKGYKDGRWEISDLSGSHLRPIAEYVIYCSNVTYSIPMFSIEDVDSTITVGNTHGFMGKEVSTTWKLLGPSLLDLKGEIAKVK